MGQYGAVYLNFGLWGLALVPAWLIVKEIGCSLGERKFERERGLARIDEGTSMDEMKGVEARKEVLQTQVSARISSKGMSR